MPTSRAPPEGDGPGPGSRSGLGLGAAGPDRNFAEELGFLPGAQEVTGLSKQRREVGRLWILF